MAEPWELEVEVADTIWLAVKKFNRFGGIETSEIVMTYEHIAKDAEKDGWTVTKYVREES